MAVLQGYVGRIGAVSGVGPVGRITIMDPADQGTVLAQVHCEDDARFRVAMLAREVGQIVEVDVQATTNPMVADKVRLL